MPGEVTVIRRNAPLHLTVYQTVTVEEKNWRSGKHTKHLRGYPIHPCKSTFLLVFRPKISCS